MAGCVYTSIHYAFGLVRQLVKGDGSKVLMKNIPVQVLYDRTDDPYQLNNLYGKKGAVSLQREMERLTRKWLNHFDDPGSKLSLEELNHLYSYPDGHFPEDTQEQGFKGRPIDVIKNYYKSNN